jgi:hypothetical protein
MAVERRVFIPSNLDLDHLIKEYPSSRGFKPKDYKIYGFIDLLVEVRGMQESLRGKYGDYSFLHSKRLKTLFGDEVKIMIDWLKYAGVIESDNHFEIGLRPKGYRLTEKYIHSAPVEKKIKKSTLIKKMKQKSRKQKKTQSKYDYLYTFFDGLEIDKERAERYACDFFQNYSKEYQGLLEQYNDMISCSRFSQKSIKKPKFPISRLNYDLHQIDKIATKDFTFVQDDTSSRLHTNLTSIRSGLRDFISYKGEELVSIDFVNSQPLISSALLNPNFYMSGDVFTSNSQTKMMNTSICSNISSNYDDMMFNCKDVAPNIYDIIQHDVATTSSIMFPEMDVSTENTSGYSYKELCEKGELYEYLERVALPSFTSSNTLSRQEVKGLVFQMMFTSNKFIGQDAAKPKRIFRDLFPNEYKLFASIKRKDHSNLPILLQKIESKLMYERIVARIHNNRPDVPMFTIHDSIVTTVDNQDYVQRVMLEEMKSALGLNAKTKIEYWRSDSEKVNLVKKVA